MQQVEPPVNVSASCLHVAASWRLRIPFDEESLRDRVSLHVRFPQRREGDRNGGMQESGSAAPAAFAVARGGYDAACASLMGGGGDQKN
jgi:hypothetical protein